MSDHAYETIRYDVTGAVATVALDRPERYHAFDEVMCEELAAVWAEVRHDDSVSVVVITATGDKAFCTGVDRDFVPSEGGADYDFTPYTYDDPGKLLGPRANDVWKPVIGAVNGMACGGAFYLLGECDFLIAAEHATFFDPHVTYGMPAVFEPMSMMRRMPFGEVMRMTLTGNHERLSAQRALEIGLVSQVVPGAELASTAATVASEIASQPLGALMATVRTMWAAREVSPAVAASLGNTFLHLGMTEAAMDEGSKVFASGARIDPRIR
ncbi:MAG: enoyl-CoA hydratase/isomerase family protein [Actinobacteria bacterium]|nr:enoyl-CoA hydratase/isomerase family protein [Actinomycetota bacterium]